MESLLPTALLESLKEAKGFDEQAFIQAHTTPNSVVSVRLNPAKPFDLAQSNFKITDPVPWNTHGYYLAQRPSFTLDPFFHAGAYYVQEASSMFLEQALTQTCDLSRPLRVLDLCAAPGGKSTLIQSLISAESVLVCNEVIKTRVNVLTENMTKWGGINTVVTHNDPKDFQQLPDFFDVMVVDAPCSGSGLFRKDPAAMDEWSEQLVTLCSQRQQRILADALPALKPGGILIYSTCSFSEAENESIADWLTGEEGLESISLQIKEDWHITETVSPQHNAAGYRFYPHEVRGEGFFLAAFRKPLTNESNSFSAVKNNFDALSKTEQSIVDSWIKKAPDHCFVKFQKDILLFNHGLQQTVSTLQSCLYIKSAGINIGTLVRDECIPSHGLAMSGLTHENIPVVTLNEEAALNYLRRADLLIDAATKGWTLIRFFGLALGFAKILPNRINNYYPKEWRIINK
jgi:16S rRNA C967 or C1407 C5-methylase (RsmB/RsmF family)/NOL1/NOP2/fmu family ribosome biogenesis protein